MTDGNTHAIAQHLDEREDWDALQEVKAELEQAEARIAELEAMLAKAMNIAEVLSGCVEYDYHGNVCGEEEAKAIAALAELKGETDE
jgi:hypothetical protein